MLFTLMQAFAWCAYSNTFTVTSNANTGTGSLREALTLAAANGAAEQDFIYFNLPDISESGRTITLETRLPDVSSNLVIDGATQTGNPFGVSTARIQIVTNFTYPNVVYGLLLSEVQQVAVYGLYIRNFIIYPANQNRNYWQGIAIRNCRDIQIGAAGKGNVVNGFQYNLGINVHLESGQITYHSVDLTIKANLIDIDADGKTFTGYQTLPVQSNFINGKLEIGGTPEEGNLFPRGFRIYQTNSFDYTGQNVEMYNMPATVRISNNKIGVDIDENPVTGSVGLSLSNFQVGGKNTVIIEDNLLSGGSSYGLQLVGNKYEVVVRRNYIGTNRSLNKKLPTGGTGIFVYYCDNVKIGSANVLDANYIGNCKPVYVWPYSTVSVNKNSFFCTQDAYPMIFVSYGTRFFPVIKISSIAGGLIKGTATPNATIELFYADKCGTCSPETYFDSTIADANGNWEYQGAIIGTVIASATLNGATSEFTRTIIDASQLKIVNTCSNAGSITGIVPLGASVVNWLDELGNVVGTEADLKNVAPGKYKLKIVNGDCSAETPYYQIKKSIDIDGSTLKKADASCGTASGFIKDLTVINNTNLQLLYSWTDGSGAEVGRAKDITGVKPGNYTLSVRTSDNNCTQLYGPVTLRNLNGPNLDESGASSSPSLCTNATGGITGIIAQGTGVITYKWRNQAGEIVGNSLELVGQAAGIYTLEIADASGCGSITSSPFTISEVNGVMITDLGRESDAACGKSNGAVQGISVSGATSYQWYDDNGRLLSGQTNVDLLNVVAGNYYLVASNSSCSKKSKIYSVKNLINNIDYGTVAPELTNASCGLDNGAIKITFTKTTPVGYRWVNKSTGENLHVNGGTLTGLDKGVYLLYLLDANGCEQYYHEFTISREQELMVDDRNITLVNDQCGLGKGSISRLNASGKAPLSYSWKNQNGQVVSTEKDLIDVSAGDYALTVTDALSCSQVLNYKISNVTLDQSVPEISDLNLCGTGDAILVVSNILKGYNYRIYKDEFSITPMDEQTNGKFRLNIQGNSVFYVSQVTGTCESPRKKVLVKVGYAAVKIPGTFSPNNDGYNDTWVITGLESYQKINIQLFNRAGSKVFETRNFETRFDGNFNGHPLPVGVYYYIINIGDGCKPVSGSLTIIK